MYYFPVSALLIEYLILTIVDSRDSYGYEISQTIKLVADIKESTLYPILKRMEKSRLRHNLFTGISGKKEKILLHHSFWQRTDALSAYRMERLPGYY